MNRLQKWLFFLSVAAFAWLPQAGAMVRPFHQSDFTSSSISQPDFQAAETETLIVADESGCLWLAEYAGTNPYTGENVYVLSPLGLQMAGSEVYIAAKVAEARGEDVGAAVKRQLEVNDKVANMAAVTLVGGATFIVTEGAVTPVLVEWGLGSGAAALVGGGIAGGYADLAAQGTEGLLGERKEYDPTRTLVMTAGGACLNWGGYRVGQLLNRSAGASVEPAIAKAETLTRPVAKSPTAFKSMLQKVDTLDFSTPRNGAVFYSGPGQEARAMAYAQKIPGRMTIEMTPGGKYLSANIGRFTRAQQDLIWQRASTPFAKGASGRINAFIKGADPARTFRTIEEDILDESSDVTRSIYHY